MEKRLTLEEIEELKKAAKTLGFSFVMEDMLSNEELKKRFASVYELEIDDPKRFEIMEEACLDLAMQFEDAEALMDLTVNIVDADLHESLAKAVLKNHKKLNCIITPEMAADIAFSVESQAFLRECIEKHEEYNIDAFGVNLLESVLLYYSADFVEEEPSAADLVEMEKFVENLQNEYSGDLENEDEERKFIWESAYGVYHKGYYNPHPDFFYEVDRPLDYSKAEMFAIRIYEGVNPGGGTLGDDLEAYKTINAMNYPGIANELERIFDDKAVINPTAIFQSTELMSTSLDLYSVMYKYGQRMTKDRKGYRVDRASAAKLIYETGRVVSNFSTSTTGYKNFSKADIALEEVVIKKGTPCADFKEVFGAKDYELSGESEILVAPGALVVSEAPRPPQSPEELKMKNKSFKPASAVYVMTVSPPEKPKELTQAEEEDMFQSEIFLHDEKNRARAATFITKLVDLSHQGYSKDEAMKIISEDDMKAYLAWKEAFQRVYGYATRQIALQIDQDVEKARQNGEPLFSPSTPNYYEMDEEQNSGANQTIPIDEITKMVEGKNLQKTTDKAKELLDFLGNLEKKNLGEKDINENNKDDGRTNE